jgi:putative hydrolase of the HAD superfamily
VHAVFVSGEVGVAKPAAVLFEHALRWAELPAEDCLFVGDDPVDDIAAAATLGMTTVWRVRGTWPYELDRPHHEIHSLAELEGIT